MNSGLPPILAYHPEIQVDKALPDGGTERHVLKMTLDDFEPDEKILSDLARAYKVDTVGEVLEKFMASKMTALPPVYVRAAKVEKVEGVVPQKAGEKVWAWAEKVSKPLY